MGVATGAARWIMQQQKGCRFNGDESVRRVRFYGLHKLGRCLSLLVQMLVLMCNVNAGIHVKRKCWYSCVT